MLRYRWLAVAVAVSMSLFVVGCGGDDDTEASGDDDGASSNDVRPAEGSPPEWPAPEDPAARVRAAGLELERREQLQTHRHTHLDVFFNGKRITIPAGVGIDITDPGVQHSDGPDGPSYGGIEECDNPCISPLHTHDETGMLHTESTSDDLRTLGQFFLEWGVRLDDDCVGDYCTSATDIAVYVDGDRVRDDPADITLTDGTEIAIVIGSPPDRIPDEADFSQA